jgi:hypothetical protein
MENFTSDKWIDFMERSVTVRSVAVPGTLDTGIMLRGDSEPGYVSYQVGLVSGNGPNRPGIDARAEAVGRVVVRPLADRHDALSKLHIGGSFRWGKRDPNFTWYDAPSLTTGGGYAFFEPKIGKGATETHIFPSDVQMAAAAEVYLPFDRFDLRAEAVFVNEERREAFLNTPWTTERAGTFKGLGYYVMASVWPFGTPRINGEPGTYGPPTLSPNAKSATASDFGLQLMVRWEQLMFDYDSIAKGGDMRGLFDADTTKIRVNVAQFGATYWASRHVRLTAEYSLYMFPGTPPASNDLVGVTHTPPTPATNLATAPGARNGAFDFSANALHEFSARVGLAF